MKLNNSNQIAFINISLLSIILICFALDKCAAHSFTDIASKKFDSEAPSSFHPPEAPDAESPTSTSSFPPSEAPDAESPASKSSFPPSEAPDAESPVSAFSFPPEGEYGASPEGASPEGAPNPSSGDSFGYSSSFSGAFSDILKGDPSTRISPEGSSTTKNYKNSVIEQICGHTRYPDICINTVQPLVNHNIKIDVTKVLEISINACAHQVELTITKVEKHAAKSPDLANALADCKEKYKNALVSLKSAIGCIPNHDFGKLTVTLSGVMADVSTCESKFEDLKSPTATSQTDGLVSIMVNNCLSIASLVRH